MVITSLRAQLHLRTHEQNVNFKPTKPIHFIQFIAILNTKKQSILGILKLLKPKQLLRFKLLIIILLKLNKTPLQCII